MNVPLTTRYDPWGQEQKGLYGLLRLHLIARGGARGSRHKFFDRVCYEREAGGGREEFRCPGAARAPAAPVLRFLAVAEGPAAAGGFGLGGVFLHVFLRVVHFRGNSISPDVTALQGIVSTRSAQEPGRDAVP